MIARLARVSSRVAAGVVFGCVAAVAPLAPCAADTRTRVPTEFDLSTATVADIQAAMDAGALTSEHLVELYLARIAAYDRQGPRLNSVIVVNQHALEQARALDAERSERGARGPLHGVAVIVKDVFDTKDMPTSGGFLPMAASQPDRDAFVISRLRDAGAVILAKLNQTDWYGKGPSSGSSITGATLSPYNASKYPGASSTGSGVATAAWLGTVALGSDTGGSLVIPAALNNVAVIAPTRGLVSRSGMMWNSPRQEKGGPMCRSVYDCAAVLDAIAGYDAADLSTEASFGAIPATPYTSFVDPDGLRGARLGVLDEMIRNGAAHAAGRSLFDAALDAMRGAGAIVVDPVRTGLDLPAEQAAASSAQFEQAVAADHYLSGLPPGAPMRSLEEMLAKAGASVNESLVATAGIASLDDYAPFLSALKQQDVLRAALIAVMDRHELEALVLPYRTLPPPDLAAGTMTAADRKDRRNGLHAYTGLPTILVPGGFFPSDGMPFAVQLIGRPFSESTLIRLASGFEATTKHRKAPEATPPLRGERFSF